MNHPKLDKLDSDELELLFQNPSNWDQVQINASSQISKLLKYDPTGRMARHVGMNVIHVNQDGILRLPPLQTVSASQPRAVSSNIKTGSAVEFEKLSPTAEKRISIKPPSKPPIETCKGIELNSKLISAKKPSNVIKAKVKGSSASSQINVGTKSQKICGHCNKVYTSRLPFIKHVSKCSQQQKTQKSEELKPIKNPCQRRSSI